MDGTSKRSRYESPQRKVDALLRVEALIGGGLTVRKAVDAVAEEMGMSVRSIFTYRKLTDFVPRDGWETALARKPQADDTRSRSECHPDALAMLVGLCRRGVRVSDGYREMLAVARQNDWGPVPSERTLRRLLSAGGHTAAGYKARRNARPSGP